MNTREAARPPVDERLRTRCQPILDAIKSKKKDVAGGSDQTGRYMMKDPKLYFRLGVILDEYAKENGAGDDRKTAFIRNATAGLNAEFGFEKTGIFINSVRFVDSFKDEEYFIKVAKMCNNSAGQLREVTDILSRDNPLNISPEDLAAFTKQLSSKTTTYEKMRELARSIKQKYGVTIQVDFSKLEDSFDAISDQVSSALGGTPQERKKLNQRLGGSEFIGRLRFLLAILARESMFATNFNQKKAYFENVTFPQKTHNDFINLYNNLLKVAKEGTAERERLRNRLTPFEMGQLQTKLKAIENEDNYNDYIKNVETFKHLRMA